MCFTTCDTGPYNDEQGTSNENINNQIMHNTININEFVYIKGNQELIGEKRALPRGNAYSIQNVIDCRSKKITIATDLSYYEVKLSCYRNGQFSNLYIAISEDQWEKSLEPELRYYSLTNSDCTCMKYPCSKIDEIANFIEKERAQNTQNNVCIYQ